MGRRTVLTKRQRVRYLKALERGLTRDQAARAAGWSVRTVARWPAYGRDEPESVHGEVLADVEAAEEAFRQAAAAEFDGPDEFWVTISLKHGSTVTTFKPPGWTGDDEDGDDEDDDADPYAAVWRPTC